jgi:Peptidase family C25
MKRLFLVIITVCAVLTGYTQLNNSWIDYNKTYYKFKIAKDSLCRITQPVLAAAGLGSTPAQNFQLWRNGKQVRLFTSVATGSFTASDYIEFWGEANDGKPDKSLYFKTESQLDDKYSLFSDTAVYYLTVNPAGGNLRYIQSVNPVTGNTLTAEPYFMKRLEVHYKNQINRGYGENYGQNVYSSAFDIGEGWTSAEIGGLANNTFVNINKFDGGPANSVQLTISAFGNRQFSNRNLAVKINGTAVLSTPGNANQMNGMTYHKDTVKNLPLSLLQNNTDLQITAGIENSSTPGNDAIVIASLSLTYPATFNFNNGKNFYFELPAGSAGNYLVITNFNNNGIVPALYDITGGRRYAGDISTAGQVKFVLPPSVDPLRKFILVSEDASNNLNISQLTPKTFFNFTSTANQGDYIIISNPVLYDNGSGINYVEQYRQYRSTAAGGAYTAKLYDVNELAEQFGFGISQHPAAIRDFIRYANQSFSIKPKSVFLIGRGVTYYEYNISKNESDINKLALIPTFGWPASDVLLASNPGSLSPLAGIGRIGAVNGNEVGNYFQKVKQYEQAQQSTSQTVADKGWLKNFLHAIGATTTDELNEFLGYLNNYKSIAADTLMGARVETYSKSSSSPAQVEQAQSALITQLFQQGLGYISYFGHAGATTLAINLNYPENYNNAGKYPFMQISGCSVGDYYDYHTQRLQGYNNMSLSEKYTFINQKGSIGFLASTHYGLAGFLDDYNKLLYKNFCNDKYGVNIGEQIKSVLEIKGFNPLSLNHLARLHLEETNLQGDPAIKIINFAKPDFVIEDALVSISPGIVSVADGNFNVNIKMMNIGRAVNDSIRVTVKQKLPNDSIRVLYNRLIPAIRNTDSLVLTVPINPLTDKGLNKLIISLDDGNRVTESSETNNILERDFYIFQDELRPISPYNYSIVNQQNISFYASTANPLSGVRQYTMEVDTTELFNSPYKKTYNTSGNSGLIQFNPGNLGFTDSMVYYWRVAMVPTGTADYIWNTSSFVYLSKSSEGFTQSHYYQFLKSTFTDIHLLGNRKFAFDKFQDELLIATGNYPPNDFPASNISLNSIGRFAGWGLAFNTLQFVVLEGVNGLPKINVAQGSKGSYGSALPTFSSRYQFEFPFANSSQRKVVMDFIDSMPSNATIILYPLLFTSSTLPYASDWKADQSIFGAGNSLYHKLFNYGFTTFDSFNSNKPFLFIFNKANYFPPIQKVGATFDEIVSASLPLNLAKQPTYISSPYFGPAKKWMQFHWRGKSEEIPQSDIFYYEIYGTKSPGNGADTKLITIYSAKDTAIDFIDPVKYPYLKVKMYSSDFGNGTPFQLSSVILNGDFVPEGAVAPNIAFSMKDTFELGEKIAFKLAFKNISAVSFDSLMKINFIITGQNNISNTVTASPKGKKLLAGDTLLVDYQIDTKNYPGNNTLVADINPDNDQPEQLHFNNILFKIFYVKSDNNKPLIDVTFDGVHILNKDIVAAKPHIYVSLKDDNKFIALNDTALLKVQVLYPDKTLHNYNFGDTMRFNPANLGSGANSASIDFLPYFPIDGDYELIVSGKDAAGNSAGSSEYRVAFKVINKPMISNLLNYPNPFTTSTAFVFTVTGSEVPQNIRIQILTISGKIVREITKDELGPVHVGRNITEFKWDGTDTYGQKLANGVYLYRVITNLNGKALDKYKTEGDNTDKYFNNGYGKMMLIR